MYVCTYIQVYLYKYSSQMARLAGEHGPENHVRTFFVILVFFLAPCAIKGGLEFPPGFVIQFGRIGHPLPLASNGAFSWGTRRENHVRIFFVNLLFFSACKRSILIALRGFESMLGRGKLFRHHQPGHALHRGKHVFKKPAPPFAALSRCGAVRGLLTVSCVARTLAQRFAPTFERCCVPLQCALAPRADAETLVLRCRQGCRLTPSSCLCPWMQLRFTIKLAARLCHPPWTKCRRHKFCSIFSVFTSVQGGADMYLS